MGPDLDEVVFEVEDVAVTWDDVRRAPSLATWWDRQRTAAAGRRAALSRAVGAGAGPTDDEVHRAGVAFRRHRRLLAADDLRAWLGAWHLTVDEWRTTLARLAVEPVESGVDDLTEGELWADVAVSGSIEEATWRLAAEHAARLTVDDLQGPDAALERTVAEATTPAAVRAEVERRRLDWTAVDATALTFAHPDAAREALLVVNHDGERPDVVADRSNQEAVAVRTTFAELGGGRQGAVMSAAVGQAVGPFPARADASDDTTDGWDVLVVHHVEIPTPDDAAVRDRAVTGLTERAVDQLVEAHVSWNEAWL